MLLHGSETIMALSLKPGKDIWSMHNFHLVMNNSLVAVRLLVNISISVVLWPDSERPRHREDKGYTCI